MFSAKKFLSSSSKLIEIISQPQNDGANDNPNQTFGATTWRVASGYKRSAVSWEWSLDENLWNKPFVEADQTGGGIYDPATVDRGFGLPPYYTNPWDPMWRGQNIVSPFSIPPGMSNRQDGAFWIPDQLQDVNMNSWKWRAKAYAYPQFTNLPNYSDGGQPYEFAHPIQDHGEGSRPAAYYVVPLVNIPPRTEPLSFMILRKTLGIVKIYTLSDYQDSSWSNEVRFYKNGVEDLTWPLLCDPGTILGFQYEPDNRVVNGRYLASLMFYPANEPDVPGAPVFNDTTGHTDVVTSNTFTINFG